MATKPKRYDLNAADRRRNMLIRIGLTAIVVVFAVALVLYIMTSHDKATSGGQDKAIRVTSSKLVTKPGTNEPKAVLSVYEDFLCSACGSFEKGFGATVSKLIDTGAVAVDYHMVTILDQPSTDHYSSRAAAAAYCVADESVDAFRRFHAALYAQQPNEMGPTFPTNAQLIETARQAGVVGNVPDCINSGKYLKMVQGIAPAADIHSTPTIKLNGKDYKRSTPQALIDNVKQIVGDVPGLNTPAQAPAS